MLTQNLIKNYSTTLFKSAMALSIQDKVFEQLESINLIIESDQTLRKMFFSPIVKNADKLRLIRVIVDGLKIEQILEEFLLLTVRHSRINLFNRIARRYKLLLDTSKDIKDIKVTSSKVLNSDEREEIKNYLAKDFVQEINVEFNCNVSIIGGILVQYDSKLIDYSIAGLLTNVSNKAKGAMLN